MKQTTHDQQALLSSASHGNVLPDHMNNGQFITNSKTKFMKTRIILSVIVVMIFGFLLTGCQHQDDNISNNNELSYEKLIQTGEKKQIINNIGVPYVIRDQVKKGERLPISVGSSPVPYYLPKEHPQYDRLYDIFMSEDIVFYDITYLDKSTPDLGYPIIDVKPVEKDIQTILLEEFKNSVEKDSDHSSLQKFKESNSDDVQHAQKTTTIISLSQATSFFNAMKNRSCGLAPNSPSDCIPFQYTRDGCYVRAQYMRLKFQQMFGGDCEKIFAVQSTSAWLKATTTIPCCQNWSWHMAPLVKVTTSSGLKNYVIDPGLFNGPVTEATWIAKLRGGCATSSVPVPLYAIKSGNTYSYNPTTGNFITSTSGYSTDRLWLANQSAGCIRY